MFLDIAFRVAELNAALLSYYQNEEIKIIHSPNVLSNPQTLRHDRLYDNAI